MIALSARTTVSELQEQRPALLQVLRSTGLYRDGDDSRVTLAQLCWTFGFNPGILLLMLESADLAPEEPPVDVSALADMSLTEVITHIEELHHHYLRAELPQLESLTQKVATVHAGNERLGLLRDEVRELAQALELHLQHEEEALFPMVRDLESRGVITPTRCGSAVGGPITCMENEHEEAARVLRRLRELTNDYSAPPDACGTWQHLLERLARFDRDMQEHMYKENKVLFPRALEAQEQRVRPAAH
jgi:regulator of cell morphogenesis and NO signaling